MKVRKLHFSLALAIVAASSLTIAGCAPSGSEAESELIYIKAMGGDAMTTGLNAQFVGSLSANTYSSQILEPLIFSSGDFQLTPALAESWELSDDGLTLALTIREGVTWHDGEPFTAEDVKFNFDEIIPLQVYGAPLAERIKSVEIVDDSVVELELSEPYGPLLETIAEQFMLPKHLYEGTDYVTNSANNEDIIGTGPMKFASYSPGAEIVLEKNSEYWGGEVQADRAIFAQIVDPNTRAESLFAGEADEAHLSPAALGRVEETESTEIIRTGFYPYVIPLIFNTDSQYLADPAVRGALFAALDREALAETALFGAADAATGFFPEGFDWALNEDVDFDSDFPRDIDKINETLDDAGFPRGADGTRFTLSLHYVAPRAELVSVGDLMQSMYADIGVELKIVASSGAVYQEKIYGESDFDLAITTSSLGPEPSVGLTRWYTCNKDGSLGANPSGVCDDEIDAAGDDALATVDQEERGEHYKAMQARAEELMFYAPLAWYFGSYPVANNVRWNDVAPKEFRERVNWLTMTPAQ